MVSSFVPWFLSKTPGQVTFWYWLSGCLERKQRDRERGMVRVCVREEWVRFNCELWWISCYLWERSRKWSESIHFSLSLSRSRISPCYLFSSGVRFLERLCIKFFLLFIFLIHSASECKLYVSCHCHHLFSLLRPSSLPLLRSSSLLFASVIISFHSFGHHTLHTHHSLARVSVPYNQPHSSQSLLLHLFHLFVGWFDVSLQSSNPSHEVNRNELNHFTSWFDVSVAIISSLVCTSLLPSLLIILVLFLLSIHPIQANWHEKSLVSLSVWWVIGFFSIFILIGRNRKWLI